ncbi:MAG: Pirin family protein [Frankiales bacterium]|nr:Pirin family protein [Frankiales bacterium]
MPLVSGPVTTSDAAPGPAREEPDGQPVLELVPSHETVVGGVRVRRALPRRARRTVGAWCFADHLGPTSGTDADPLDVGPHPHTGLATVTWLLSGRLLHTDSLGTEQVVAPGQLNLMTAGAGVSHAEEQVRGAGAPLHGLQLWVAQPDSTRGDGGAFEHLTDLPQEELSGVVTTTLVGGASPARADTALLGVDLALHGGLAALPLRPDHEHALVVLEGAVAVGETRVEPGRLAYLGTGRDELVLDADGPARAVLLGGEPFPEPVVVWWNFVGRSREEVGRAYEQWEDAGGEERFGRVPTRLPRVPAPRPPWYTGR